MSTYTTANEAYQAIIDILGEFADEHDIDAIFDEVFECKHDTNEEGQIFANSYRYEWTVEGDDFWAVVEKHAI